jgi:hypothetical protein
VELLRLSGRRRGGAALGAPRRAVPCGVGEAVRARLTVVPDQERVLAQGLVDDVDGPIVGDPRPGEAVEGMGRPPDTIPALRRGVPRLGDPGGDHLVARGVRGAREDLPVVHRRRRGRSAEARVEEGVDGSGLARPVPHGQLGPRRRARAGVRWGARVRRGRVRRGARVRLGRAGVFRLGRAGVLRPGEAGVGRRGSRVQREPRVGLGHRRAVDGDASELWLHQASDPQARGRPTSRHTPCWHRASAQAAGGRSQSAPSRHSASQNSGVSALQRGSTQRPPRQVRSAGSSSASGQATPTQSRVRVSVSWVTGGRTSTTAKRSSAVPPWGPMARTRTVRAPAGTTYSATRCSRPASSPTGVARRREADASASGPGGSSKSSTR